MKKFNKPTAKGRIDRFKTGQQKLPRAVHKENKSKEKKTFKVKAG